MLKRVMPQFLSNFFCLTVRKNFIGEPFSESIISDIEKFYAQEGYLTIFRRVFLSRFTENVCSGNLLYCVSESFR